MVITRDDIKERLKNWCPMVDIEDFDYCYQNTHDDYNAKCPIEILDKATNYVFLRDLDERLCSIINDEVAIELGRYEEDDGI